MVVPNSAFYGVDNFPKIVDIICNNYLILSNNYVIHTHTHTHTNVPYI